MGDVVANWFSQVIPLPWMQENAAVAQQALRNQAWPTAKSEHWKYTSLRPIERGTFDFTPIEDRARVNPEAVNIAGLDAINLVFVDGQFRADLSSYGTLSDAELPEGLSIVDFADASEPEQEFIRQKLQSNVSEEKHLFARISQAMIQNGVLLRVEPNARIERPVQISHYSTSLADKKGLQHRLLVQLGHHAEMALVESFASDDSHHAAWMNQVTELIQDEGSVLEHYRLHREQQALSHTGGVHVSLQASARLNSFILGYGGTLKRIDYSVRHLGQGAECDLQGVYLIDQKQHFDLHTQIEHVVAHCRTNEVFRGIVDDHGSAVFNGRIHIHPDAQKTLAEMSNRNMLLSENARINTKPELEIYADDVKCAHGATVSQMDATALSYLRTRGISQAEASLMLSFGFINEILMTIRHPAILDSLRPSIVRRFGKEEAHMRHLL